MTAFELLTKIKDDCVDINEFVKADKFIIKDFDDIFKKTKKEKN